MLLEHVVPSGEVHPGGKATMRAMEQDETSRLNKQAQCSSGFVFDQCATDFAHYKGP